MSARMRIVGTLVATVMIGATLGAIAGPAAATAFSVQVAIPCTLDDQSGIHHITFPLTVTGSPPGQVIAGSTVHALRAPSLGDAPAPCRSTRSSRRAGS